MKSSPRRRSRCSGSSSSAAVSVDEQDSALFDLEPRLDAVQLSRPRVPASGQATRDAAREHLFSDLVGVALDDRGDRAVVAERDAVGDVEARLLAQLVQLVRELARETFRLELGRERGVERDDETLLA